MSTGLFEQYEQNYTQVSTSVSRKLNTQLPSQSGGTNNIPFYSILFYSVEQRKETVRQIDGELKALEEACSGMEMELNALPPATRNRLIGRFRSYQTDLTKLRADYVPSSLYTPE